MNKPIKIQQLYVGQLICVNSDTETQVYTIAKIDRLDVLLMWKEGTHDCQQWTDYSYCYKPTLEQIEYSITQNGPLVPASAI